MQQQKLSTNDGILLISLLYSCGDMAYEWDSFSECRQPIHKLLLASYACVVSFRILQLVGSRLVGSCPDTSLGSGLPEDAAVEFLLNMRQKSTFTKSLAALSWLLALPFFSMLTVVGTYWFSEVMKHSPQCLPSPTHIWFTGLWLLISYVWILVHLVLLSVAWMLEKRVQTVEGDVRSVEDNDSRSRWGDMTRLSNYTAVNVPGKSSGLSPSDIQELGGLCSYSECIACTATECSICIADFADGDNLRKLSSCGHCFHRGCIDLWLLRCASCPLCKQSVVAAPSSEAISAANV